MSVPDMKYYGGLKEVLGTLKFVSIYPRLTNLSNVQISEKILNEKNLIKVSINLILENIVIFIYVSTLLWGNGTPDYYICTRNKNGNIKNQRNVGSKLYGSTKKNCWHNKNRQNKKPIIQIILWYPP